MCSRLPRPCAPFLLPSPRPLPSVPPSPRPFAPFPLRRRHGGRVQVRVPGLRRRRYRHPGHVGLHVCFRLLRDRRLHVLQGHRQLLHLRLHRGLALQVVRDRLQRVHDGHHTCHKFANVSTCPLECEFEPGYSGDGYMMCNNISCRWSDGALSPAFESRTWPIRAGGSPGPSITLQRFPRSAPPPHMALGLISGLVSCMGMGM